MSFKKIVEEIGKDAELEYLREKDNHSYTVNPSAFRHTIAQVKFIIGVLDAILDFEKIGEDEYSIEIKKEVLTDEVK